VATPNRKPSSVGWQEPEGDFYAQNDNDRTTSGAFSGAQTERTISGQFNQYRTESTPRYAATNDNKKAFGGSNIQQEQPSAFSSHTSRQVTRFKKGNPRSGIRRFVRRKSAAKKSYAYARVTLVNVSIFSWGMTLWLLQVKLALVNIVVIGLASVIDAAYESISGDGIIGAVVDGVYETFDFLWQALNWVLEKAFGISINFDLESMIFATTFLPFFIGMATLLIMGIQYELARMNSLTGEGAHLKMSAFIFALFGYLMPMLNLFPWFIFWALAVWRYPK
jgi:hypothetical protein